MKSDKYERLKAVGFNFGGPKQAEKYSVNPEEWHRYFVELENYKEEHGHTDVPQRSGP